MGQAPDYPEPVFVMPEQKKKMPVFQKIYVRFTGN